VKYDDDVPPYCNTTVSSEDVVVPEVAWYVIQSTTDLDGVDAVYVRLIDPLPVARACTIEYDGTVKTVCPDISAVAVRDPPEIYTNIGCPDTDTDCPDIDTGCPDTLTFIDMPESEIVVITTLPDIRACSLVDLDEP
jgi:hypothetical protein